MRFSRIGLIGDVHAEAERLKAALVFLSQAEVDAILCTGDVADGMGDVNECCELLQQANALMVRGNHDRWLLENQMRQMPEATRLDSISENSRRFLATLLATRSVETALGPLLLCHGVGANDMRRLMPDDVGYSLEANDELQALIAEREFRVVVGGHTHHRMVRQFSHLTFINAGTLYDSHDPCVSVLDLTTQMIWFHEFKDHEIAPVGEKVSLTK